MSTVVNQGTTIDNLPNIPDGVDKQTFIDSAFVPIRGKINGTDTTVKVTGSDLASSGENKIDSISVNGSPVAPVNKNVDLTIPAEQVNADWTENDDSEPSFIANKPFDKVDGSGGLDIIKGSLVVQIDHETIRRHDGGTLYVANPVPEPAANHADAGKVLTVKTVDNVDEIVWDAPQGGGNIPDPTDKPNGYVLTVNNGAAGWAPAAGGGGAPVYVYYDWMHDKVYADQALTDELTSMQLVSMYNNNNNVRIICPHYDNLIFYPSSIKSNEMIFSGLYTNTNIVKVCGILVDNTQDYFSIWDYDLYGDSGS